jgi:hypothetical protein
MCAMVPERLDAYLAGTTTKASHTADRLAYIIMRIPKAILTLSFILLSVLGCEEDEPKTDYRELFVGSFTLKSYLYSYIYSIDTTYYSDTITFQGSIAPDNENDSVIIIKYRPPGSDGYTCNQVEMYGSEVAPFLYTYGSLGYPYFPPGCPVYLFGQFHSTDSLHFVVGIDHAGGRQGHVVSGSRN